MHCVGTVIYCEDKNLFGHMVEHLLCLHVVEHVMGLHVVEHVLGLVGLGELWMG